MFPLIFNTVARLEAVQMDVWEDDSNLFVALGMPGYEKGDIAVIAENGLLTISAKREEKADKSYLVRTIISSVNEAVRLPKGLDESKADANYENGILTVTIPFEAKRAKLPIKVK